MTQFERDEQAVSPRVYLVDAIIFLACLSVIFGLIAEAFS